ncbi:MAG: hypothetical protein LBJ63_10345 [Prevotellaceae bacterium]|nr:hypothetical protein [Prevotellaceae bacterium]
MANTEPPHRGEIFIAPYKHSAAREYRSTHCMSRGLLAAFPVIDSAPRETVHGRFSTDISFRRNAESTKPDRLEKETSLRGGTPKQSKKIQIKLFPDCFLLRTSQFAMTCCRAFETPSMSVEKETKPNRFQKPVRFTQLQINN